MWFVIAWFTPCHVEPVMFHITAMCHTCYGILNHLQLSCLLNSMFKLTTRKSERSALLVLCEGNPLVTKVQITMSQPKPITKPMMTLFTETFVTCEGNSVCSQREGTFLINEMPLTHLGQMKHIYIRNGTIIGSDNGLLPGRCLAITWINAWILLFGSLGANFIGILFEIHAFSFKKMDLNLSPAKWRSFCLYLHVFKSLSYSVSESKAQGQVN